MVNALPEFNNPRNEAVISPPKTNEFQRIIKVMFNRPLVIFGVVVIGILVLMAIFAPLLAPHDPYALNFKAVLQQPTSEYLLGTDASGRDILSRVIYGSRISIIVGVLTTTISSVIGIVLGLVAGYYGRIINNVIMRIIDALMSLPPLLLALAIVAILGAGLMNLIIALSVSLIPTYCRLMCGQVLSFREADWVISGRAVGANDFRIMFRHILPNAFPSILVLITLNMGMAILAESSLSFLGVGVIAPTAAWGAMVADGRQYLLSNPLLSLAPGLLIFLVVLAFSMVGDGLRDALDPRLRGTL
ncbi:MAG: ABC transporter permease [Dehalococcoidales bacterium]|nr:ABC transporter permease [Dehalococcoidales bacterium]